VGTDLIGKPTDSVELDIHENFWVQGTGLVVSGILKSGTLIAGNQYLIGPDKDSSFTQVIIKSLHMVRIPVDKCFAGVFCTANLRAVKKKNQLDKNSLRKGMIILSCES
jgi:GTPase